LSRYCILQDSVDFIFKECTIELHDFRDSTFIFFVLFNKLIKISCCLLEPFKQLIYRISFCLGSFRSYIAVHIPRRSSEMKHTHLSVLAAFPGRAGLPNSSDEIQATMQSPDIKRIMCFALGPEGTNISQAAMRWINRMNVSEKSDIILCDTPEASLAQAQAVDGDGAVALFGTCAVYFALHKLFFQHPGALTFFIEEVMDLDEMQLATSPTHVQAIADGVPDTWQVASHPSPAPLVRNLGCEVKLVNSNAKAADEVAQGNAELCITTESARESRGLVKLHSFGSPAMVFFYGIIGPSIEVVRSAYARLNSQTWQEQPLVQAAL
jgi:hypothetical protein